MEGENGKENRGKWKENGKENGEGKWTLIFSPIRSSEELWMSTNPH
jgi:hypothetical protein